MAHDKRGRFVSALFGWVLFGSWPLMAFMTSALAPFGGETGQGLPLVFWTLSLASLCATMIIMAIKENHALQLLSSKGARIVALALLALSSVAMLLSGYFLDSPIAHACGTAGALFSGISSGYLIIVWQRILMALTWNKIDVLIPLCYGGSLAISFSITALSAFLGTALLFLSLIVSGFILLRIKEDDLAERHENKDQMSALKPERIPIAKRAWICTATVVVALWVPIVFVENSVVGDRTLANSMIPLAVGASTAVAAAFSYGIYVFVRRADMTLVAGIAVPLTILSLAVLCFLPQDFMVLAYVLSFAANTLMHIFLQISSISLAKNGSYSIVRSTTGILMPLYLASLFSTLLNPILSQTGVLEVSFFSTALLLLVVLFALPFSIGYRPFSFSEEKAPSRNQVVGSEAHRDTAVDSITEPMSSQSGFSGSEDPVLTMAKQYRLTKREVEVLELFAAGRDSGYIREKLFISRDTVNTHLRHIYSKLGIHSKRELLDLVEASKDIQRTS